MTVQCVLTHHAEMRMSQRGISDSDVEYVLSHGTRIWSGGVLHVYLRRKDIPPDDFPVWNRREGIQVRLDSSGAVIVTVFRNRGKRALVAIRKKSKRSRKRGTVEN